MYQLAVEFIIFKLREAAGEILRDAEATTEVLTSDRQALWAALRLSINQQFGYLMQHSPPSLCRPVAEELETKLWKVLETAAGFNIPRGVEPGGLSLRVPEIPTLDHQSFQEWAVRLPVRLYGWGLRSLADTCGPAFLGTLETAVPYMAGVGQICPMLEEIFGGEECWGAGAAREERWRSVLDSGCREGMEMKKVWHQITEEGQQAARLLGKELPKVVVTPLPGLGEGSVCGATRGRQVEAI